MRRYILRQYYSTQELRRGNDRKFATCDNSLKSIFLRVLFSKDLVEQEIEWRVKEKQPIHTPPNRGKTFMVRRGS